MEVTKDNPVIIKDDQAITKDDPVVTKDDPAVTKDGTAIAKDNTVIAKDRYMFILMIFQMRFTLKNYLLEVIRGILILTMILQIISIFAYTIQLIKVDDTVENRANQSEQSHQIMTLSGNNTMMVLKGEELTDSVYRSPITRKISNYFSVQRIM